jgi:O-methyltransferase domain/Dimerisation domain
MSSQQTPSNTLPPAAQVMQFIWPGPMSAQAIYAAAKLGIADELRAGPRTVDELAAASESHGPSLHRLLRALTAVGLFEETTPGTFKNNELSSALRSDVPGSVRPWVIFLCAPFNWKLWGSLAQTIIEGEAGTKNVYGKSFWEYLAENREEAEIFNAAMTSRSEILGAAVTGTYDFSAFKKIVDVGGGHGRLLHSILSTAPSLLGVLYDLPQVVANATFVENDVARGRAQVAGGSFLESVPAGADAYILSGVINDWNDHDALLILKNCRRAIANNGRLLLVTSLLKPVTGPSDRGNFMDVYMMLYGGRERSETEIRALLREAGFSVVRVIPTPVMTFIIESNPI